VKAIRAVFDAAKDKTARPGVEPDNRYSLKEIVGAIAMPDVSE
jgi:hypothetical protein